MAKRGPKPKGKVHIKWSSNFAYAIGLLASDGSLSKDGRHITLTSKDKEQIQHFMHGLGIKNHIGISLSGSKKEIYRVQFGDVIFYDFLYGIGFTPRKSLTIRNVAVPDSFFPDFLRGVFDGDGGIYAYWDPRWRSSYMFYICFASGSRKFIDWLQRELTNQLGVTGHITNGKRSNPCYTLKFAKKEGVVVIRSMYKNATLKSHLKRKRLKINESLRIIGESQVVAGA